MREIPLTNGGVALVDDADYEALAAFNWQRHSGGYAYRYERHRPAPGRSILMHRAILLPAAGLHVDHADGDGLNNQRANLRACTRSENLRNQRTQIRPGKGSQFKGVYWSERRQRWIVRIGGREGLRQVGSFKTELAAAEAYDEAAKAEYGAFARPNIQAANRGKIG